jgi:hypothetical protein
MTTSYIHIFGSVAVHNREDDDFVCSYLRFSGSAQINIVRSDLWPLYSQARSYIIKLRNCLNSFSTKSQVLSCVRGWRLCMFIYSVQCTIVLVIINIVAIYDQARSYIIKLRNCLNSFSTTLYVHIFGSVHAMPMKTYCIIPPFDSVKQYQLILTIVLVIINIVAIYGLWKSSEIVYYQITQLSDQKYKYKSISARFCGI